MKKRKVLSFLTAAVLAVGAVPFSVIHAAAADETYVQGDVDMTVISPDMMRQWSAAI